MKLTRLKFRDGWTIDLHEIRNGDQLFRTWPPDVERQDYLAGLARMPVSQFWEKVRIARQEEMAIA